jgi:hypothetical protein
MTLLAAMAGSLAMLVSSLATPPTVSQPKVPDLAQSTTAPVIDIAERGRGLNGRHGQGIKIIRRAGNRNGLRGGTQSIVEVGRNRRGYNQGRRYGRRNGVFLGNNGVGIQLDLGIDNRRYDRRDYGYGKCRALRIKARSTGSSYWRNRYNDCRNR